MKLCYFDKQTHGDFGCASLTKSWGRKQTRNCAACCLWAHGCQIVSVLGRGSFGVTYRASDISADRDVAIKEFFPASLALREQDNTVLPISTEVAKEFVGWRDRFVGDNVYSQSSAARRPSCVSSTSSRLTAGPIW
jgi:hypothetical protein